MLLSSADWSREGALVGVSFSRKLTETCDNITTGQFSIVDCVCLCKESVESLVFNKDNRDFARAGFDRLLSLCSVAH